MLSPLMIVILDACVLLAALTAAIDLFSHAETRREYALAWGMVAAIIILAINIVSVTQAPL